MSETPKYRDDEWLRERYLTDKMTTVEIAALCGVSHKTISRQLHRVGIPVRDNQSAQIKNPARRKAMLGDVRIMQ